MLWHGRRTVVAHGCRETKKIICGIEAENFVAYGRLPSSAHYDVKKTFRLIFLDCGVSFTAQQRLATVSKRLSRSRNFKRIMAARMTHPLSTTIYPSFFFSSCSDLFRINTFDLSCPSENILQNSGKGPRNQIFNILKFQRKYENIFIKTSV